MISNVPLLEEFPSNDKSDKNYVSITELGRKMSGRYNTVVKEDSTSNKIKVFFADDTDAFRSLLKKVIDKSEDMEILGWANDGKQAIEKVKKMDIFPDIILMDIMMPEVDGIEAVKEILKINSSLRIIMLTTIDTKKAITESFAAGAIGYLRKDGGLQLIRSAIRQAARGEVPPIQEEIAARLLGEDESDDYPLNKQRKSCQKKS